MKLYRFKKLGGLLWVVISCSFIYSWTALATEPMWILYQDDSEITAKDLAPYGAVDRSSLKSASQKGRDLFVPSAILCEKLMTNFHFKTPKNQDDFCLRASNYTLELLARSYPEFSKGTLEEIQSAFTHARGQK